jgi:hypothetical protein
MSRNLCTSLRRDTPWYLRPFVKRDEIIDADLSRAHAIKQFFNFLFGGFEVELAKGHLRPADRIADNLL